MRLDVGWLVLVAASMGCAPNGGGESCEGVPACPTAPPCKSNICNLETGTCEMSNLPDGIGCDDGNPCTQNETCHGGFCEGGAPVVCPPIGQCQVNACNPSTGACAASNAGDGTICDDGDACTVNDVCQSGSCASGPPVVCPMEGPCKLPGTCDPATGVCSSTNVPDGTACYDITTCATASCKSGACNGAYPGADLPPGTVFGSMTHLLPFKPPHIDCAAPPLVDLGTPPPTSWRASRIAVGSTGDAFFGVAWNRFSRCVRHQSKQFAIVDLGALFFRLDPQNNVSALGERSFTPGCEALSADLAPAPEVKGASSYVFNTTTRDGMCDPLPGYWPAYVDSAHGAFHGTMHDIFSNTAGAINAAGDLVAVGSEGASLLRIDKNGVTTYAKSLPSHDIAYTPVLRVNEAGDAFVSLTSLSSSIDLGCGPTPPGMSPFTAKISASGECVWSYVGQIDVLPDGAHDYLFGLGAWNIPGCDLPVNSFSLMAADPGGTCLWGKSFSYAPSRPTPTVQRLASGDLLLSGEFSGTADLGCGPVSSGPGGDYLLARLDETGACVWTKVLSSAALLSSDISAYLSHVPSVLPAPSGDIMFAASFLETIDVGGGPVVAVGVADLLVARIDGSTGTPVWVNHYGLPGEDLSRPVMTVDETGGVLVEGTKTSGPIDFGGGPLPGPTYMMRLDAQGSFRWQRSRERAVSSACGHTLVVIADDNTSSFHVERLTP